MESLTTKKKTHQQTFPSFNYIQVGVLLNTNLISCKLPFICQCKWAVNKFFELISFSECAPFLCWIHQVRSSNSFGSKMRAQSNHFKKKIEKRQRSFPSLRYLKIFCWTAGERRQMVSPASWMIICSLLQLRATLPGSSWMWAISTARIW